MTHMKIHFVRNATLIVHIGSERILVDPMLGSKGTLPPFAFLRHPARRNPTVPMPLDIEPALDTVTVGLITHCRLGHFDHLDRAGSKRLAQQKTPVYCNDLDEAYLQQRNIVTIPLRANQRHDFLGGSIIPFETVHGYGVVGKLMGPGVGYWIELPGKPTLYISGDTVLTSVVKRVLRDLRPDIAVLAAGAASLDVGKPILMPMTELIEFIHLSPGVVVATHMEALNHCPLTRDQFRQNVAEAGLMDKVRVPEDGEMLVFD
jgi:L-ascorbate metabolism protein UlaG (beta-lactamase superfamily)